MKWIPAGGMTISASSREISSCARKRAGGGGCRADLFSLGSVLYFCLTGEPLYGSETGYDLLVKAASGPSPEEARKIAALPAPFAEVVARALAARKEDRYPNAVAFAKSLLPHVAGEGGQTGALMQELFGEELNIEQQQLATTSAAQRAVSGLGPDKPFDRLEGDQRR